jgi:hypothetical protein
MKTKKKKKKKKVICHQTRGNLGISALQNNSIHHDGLENI